MSMTLVYIHGATATSESFNYIREHIGGRDLVLNYDSNNGFNENLQHMLETLEDINNIFFVAHSLGGIYALHLSNLIPEKIRGAVTISTPYGGALHADFAKYFLPFSKLLRDIGPTSWPMRHGDKIDIKHPWTNLVTTKGSAPWIHEPNDGVVTIASQKHHSEGMDLIEMDYNHYEVVLGDKTINIIKDKILNIQNN